MRTFERFCAPLRFLDDPPHPDHTSTPYLFFGIYGIK